MGDAPPPTHTPPTGEEGAPTHTHMEGGNHAYIHTHSHRTHAHTHTPVGWGRGATVTHIYICGVIYSRDRCSEGGEGWSTDLGMFCHCGTVSATILEIGAPGEGEWGGAPISRKIAIAGS